MWKWLIVGAVVCVGAGAVLWKMREDDRAWRAKMRAAEQQRLDAERAERERHGAALDSLRPVLRALLEALPTAADVPCPAGIRGRLPVWDAEHVRWLLKTNDVPHGVIALDDFPGALGATHVALYEVTRSRRSVVRPDGALEPGEAAGQLVVFEVAERRPVCRVQATADGSPTIKASVLVRRTPVGNTISREPAQPKLQQAADGDLLGNLLSALGAELRPQVPEAELPNAFLPR